MMDASHLHVPAILEAKNLVKEYTQRSGSFGFRQSKVKALASRFQR